MTESVKTQAHRVARSRGLDRFARFGLVCRGVLYLLISGIALQISFGGSDSEADESGAIGTVAGAPFGIVVLWLMLVGFLALAVWQLTEAVLGGEETTDRLEAAARTILYGVLVVSLARLLLAGDEGSSGDQQAQDLTAWAMGLPAGQLLVGLAGVGLIGLGLYWLVKGVARKFCEDLHMEQLRPRTRTVVTSLGAVGYAARGVVAGLAGGFLIQAALESEPDEAKGMDATLRAFADTAAGPWLLTVVAAGLLVFAAYCFCEARWRKV